MSTVQVVELSGVQVQTVELIVPGPQGPSGSGGGSAFTYLQAVPASIWVINHNLGYKPSVELLDAGSQEIEGQIFHPTINQTVVGPFNPPTAGQARLL